MLSKFAGASILLLLNIIVIVVLVSQSSSSSSLVSAGNYNLASLPSTMLRGPLDVWEHTFHLRKAYTDILPVLDGHEKNKGVRFVALDPLSFARNTTQEDDRQHNE